MLPAHWKSRTLTLAIGSALVVVGVVGLKSSILRKSLPEQDRSHLVGAKATEGEIYAALIRRARALDPLAKEEALKRIKNPSKLIRQGAAIALGEFEDPEALAALVDLGHDQDADVRARAIEALGSRKSEARSSALDEILDSPSRSPRDRLAGRVAQVRLAKNPEEREGALKALFGFLDKMAGDSGIQVLGAEALLSLAPTDERVISLMRSILGVKKPKAMVPTAIRHLASLQDPWVRGVVERYSKDADLETRLAVVQSLHLSCPPERVEILKEILFKEKNPMLLNAAIEASALLQNNRMAQVVAFSKDRAELDVNQRRRLAGILDAMKSGHREDACLGSEPQPVRADFIKASPKGRRLPLSHP